MRVHGGRGKKQKRMVVTEDELMDGAMEEMDGEQVPFTLGFDWNRSTWPNPRPLVIKCYQLGAVCVCVCVSCLNCAIE